MAGVSSCSDATSLEDELIPIRTQSDANPSAIGIKTPGLRHSFNSEISSSSAVASISIIHLCPESDAITSSPLASIPGDNNPSGSTSITITEPDVLVAAVSQSGDVGPYDISCYDYSDGWAQSDPTGGVPATSGYNYNWVTGGSSISTNYYIENLSAGNDYTVTITDANGCLVSESTGVLTQPSDFIANVTSDYTGPQAGPFNVIFTDNTVSTDPYNFEWTFADNSTDNYPNGTSIFNISFDTLDVGLNYIYVTLENEVTGCIDSVGFRIDVQGIPEIHNVFTPNGDNVNDYFDFEEYAMQEISVKIYNRWGQIVYSWDIPNYKWDGRDYDGRNLSEGVYYYVLSSTGIDSKTYLRKGSITLLR